MKKIHASPAMPIIHDAEPGDIIPTIETGHCPNTWLRLVFGAGNTLALSIFGDDAIAIAERLGHDLIALAKAEREKLNETKREG